MPEKFSNISRDEFERNQIEKGEIDYKFFPFKNLKVDNFNLGLFYNLVLESKNKNEDKFWRREIYLKHGVDILDLLNQNSGIGIEVGGPTTEGFNFFNLKFNSQNEFNGFESIDLFREYSKKNKIFISNILPGIYSFVSDTKSGKKDIVFEGGVDFIADATNMPLKSGDLSAFFVSNIGIISYDGIVKLKRAGIYIPENVLKSAEEEKKDLEGKSAQEAFSYIKTRRSELRRSVLKEARRLLRKNGICVWDGLFAEDLLFALEIGFKVCQIEYVIYLEKGNKKIEPEKAIFIKTNDNY